MILPIARPLSAIALLIGITCEAALAAAPDLSLLSRVDPIIEDAIAQKKCPGAVLLVGLHDQIVCRKAYGHRALEPQPVDMTADTIFDLASLSKPVGTSTSIMILADRGKLRFSDEVATYLPAFANHGKEKITIEMLMLHRGGLMPDNPIEDYNDGGAAGLQHIMDLALNWPPDTHFAYSDVGFIVLGEVVTAIDSRGLDRFAKQEVFEPLGMTDTMYNPPASLRPRIAPTERRGDHWMIGEVHDPRAYAMGGVAGHAGVFSTADDLARFCRMILHGGELDGRRILSAEMVKQWTTVHYLPDGSGRKAGRTYGFDADTGYSQPKGNRFPRGISFGHTGFTGTSFWIDPAHDCYVILLTHSVHPLGKGNVLALRRAVSNAVAEALLGPAATTGPATQP
jgi:CubicO group peptidase (beta-lactamase class C family)